MGNTSNLPPRNPQGPQALSHGGSADASHRSGSNGYVDPGLSGHGGAHVTTDGIFQIIHRQKYLAIGITVLSLALSLVYLVVAKPGYVAGAKLLVQPAVGSIINSGSNGGGESTALQSASFLDTQCEVITSTPVLALAMPNLRGLKELQDIKKPIDYLKNKLGVDVEKGKDLISVSYESQYSKDAEIVVNSVVEAYKTYQSEQRKNSAKDLLDILGAGRNQQKVELDEKARQMQEMLKQSGVGLGTDKAQSKQQLNSLSDALTKAHLETINAKAAYDESARAILGDPEKQRLVQALERTGTYSANAGEQLKTIQNELFAYQAKLADALRNYMPSHPVVRTIQGRMDQLTVASVAAAEQWWNSAQQREEELLKSFQDAQRDALAMEAKAAEYARLQADVARLGKIDDVIDSRIKDISLTQGAGALNITVLEPASAPDKPTTPARRKTVGVALVMGLILGIGLGCIRDFADGRLHTVEEVKHSLEMKVLGAIPSMGATNAHERGTLVHGEPDSVVAESYRGLRTALRFSMPDGRLKTLLITSPRSGDGKSTLVSNLAIAIAQGSKRVLVIDADLRAPMQHRLFNLKDKTGLAEVLEGHETLDRAIQPTGIPFLDLLPAGPVNHNPAELLNDSKFAEMMLDLTDRYDLVLVDSPPVTAVADARIIAATCDATLLVIRPENSNRKLAIEARDGLRSVGARLVGVAMNDVDRRAGLASTSYGYYPRAASRGDRKPTIREATNGSPVVGNGSSETAANGAAAKKPDARTMDVA